MLGALNYLEVLTIEPLHEESEGAFGCILQTVGLCLVLCKSTIERCAEDVRVKPNNLLVDQEFGGTWADEESYE